MAIQLTKDRFQQHETYSSFHAAQHTVPPLLPSEASPWYHYIKEETEIAELKVGHMTSCLRDLNAQKKTADPRCVIYISKYDYTGSLIRLIYPFVQKLANTNEVFIELISSKQQMFSATKKLSLELQNKKITSFIFTAHGRSYGMHYGNLIQSDDISECFKILQQNIDPNMRIILASCQTGNDLAPKLSQQMERDFEHVEIIASKASQPEFLIMINNKILPVSALYNPSSYYCKNIDLQDALGQPQEHAGDAFPCSQASHIYSEPLTQEKPQLPPPPEENVR